jgi:hypothetical protein
MTAIFPRPETTLDYDIISLGFLSATCSLMLRTCLRNKGRKTTGLKISFAAISPSIPLRAFKMRNFSPVFLLVSGIL